MEFTQYKCPVCNKSFEKGDDIVVCPECGAPHHRSCYELENKCFYEAEHAEGFSFEQEQKSGGEAEENSDGGEKASVGTRCPRCGTDNEPGALFCNHCGLPLMQNGAEAGEAPEREDQTGRANPFGFDSSQNPFFDPMAGLKPDEELSPGIKVSETAKFVGKRTQYFLLVFKRIKDFGRSRFNFASFLLPGVYLLYRKMTVPGLIISLLLIACNILSAYIYMTPAWSTCYNDLLSYVRSGGTLSIGSGIELTAEMMFVYLPVMLTGIRYVFMILCGLLTNRFYFRHCRKKIETIKNEEKENINEKLERAGGVNLGLAISLGAATLIVGYVCNFMLMQSGILF